MYNYVCCKILVTFTIQKEIRVAAIKENILSSEVSTYNVNYCLQTYYTCLLYYVKTLSYFIGLNTFLLYSLLCVLFFIYFVYYRVAYGKK